ncbi:hypothetical protein [Bradyrhizobium sp. ORS 375]|uniref:hypothetical protein n=1 Tax=Bradyrhizobium sp. (strain ORS 375) TaxID=566679 RepID=UPI0002E0F871|nr:hypothetical protein [Bradyrhizobium sp. ORS 375]
MNPIFLTMKRSAAAITPMQGLLASDLGAAIAGTPAKVAETRQVSPNTTAAHRTISPPPTEALAGILHVILVS